MPVWLIDERLARLREELRETRTLGTSGGVPQSEQESRVLQTVLARGALVNEANRALVRGDVVSFRESWLQASQGITGAAPYITGADAPRKVSLLKLYAYAVEVDIQGLDTNSFISLASTVLDGEERIRVRDPTLQFIRGAVAYLSGSSSALAALLGNAPGPDHEAMFVEAFVAMLKARLDRSSADARHAIATLESIEIESNDACARAWKGRIALHAADAQLLLLQLGEHDASTLEASLEHAQWARQYLDPVSVPALWGRAYAISAELFEEAAAREGRDSPLGERLERMAEQAFDISRQYR